MSTIDAVLKSVGEKNDINIDKVTVVGAGEVGMATAMSILCQGIASEVALVDMVEDRLMGQLKDIQQGIMFLNAKVSASVDYAVTAGSKVCVITAGVRQKDKETRLELVQRNTDVLKVIVPNIVKYCPDCVIIIITNPCDILAWVTWKLSGFPAGRIIGSGTTLDSARFRFLISEKLGVNPGSVHANIIAEHGESCVPLWSTINVGGARLRDRNPKIATENDPENWLDLFQNVIKSGYTVRTLKGFTNWAIGLSVAGLVKSILKNDNKVYPVSTLAKGMCGIDQEVFLSLPCCLGRNGVTQVIEVKLADEERRLLKTSADKLKEVIDGVSLT
ncbi:L-lactate dehydrogenase B chain-like [Rhynchophorus ferrugineus]|uniref:L-lactate dehydrogenase B chain-like n=1 Tax=Rhynchophorus ferrugineus TaxID=354439 RepID=UPI003FCC7673